MVYLQESQRTNFISRINIIYILGFLTFLLQIHTFFGEDIVNARDNYLTGAKTDFWGGISTLIYGHIPSIGFRWQIWLALFQVAITTIGLNKLISLKNLSKSSVFLRVLLTYLSLVFSSQMTRDGLMFSLLALGLALLKEAFQGNYQLTKFILPSILIISGMTFRPWLSIAILPLLVLLSRHSKRPISRPIGVMALLVVSVLPLAAEIAITNSLKLVKSYPEQQVIIMDIAASYCYTNNNSTGVRAMSALKLFSSDEAFPKTACQLYRPDTWLSLTKTGNTSADGIRSDFWLIEAGDSKKYKEARALWIEMISKDPVTYLQNRVIFGGKLLIGSDSRNFSFLNEKNLKLKILALYKLPYDIAITFHLFSLLATVIFLIVGPIARYRKSKSGNLIIDRERLLLFMSLLIWLGLSSIAYIGSNGRYTYTITLIALILLLSAQKENKSVT